MPIGVLSIQGSIIEHKKALEKCGIEVIEVRTLADLKKVQGLIIPGGESTVISRLLDLSKLNQEIIKRAKEGMPIYGTCAGAIVLAKKIAGNQETNCPVKNLGLMNIKVFRNAYGRQIDSFETDLTIPILGKKSFPAVFIRAPKIKIIGKKVKTLAKYGSEIIFAEEGNIMVTTFHPELTEDLRVHEYFVEKCKVTSSP